MGDDIVTVNLNDVIAGLQKKVSEKDAEIERLLLILIVARQYSKHIGDDKIPCNQINTVCPKCYLEDEVGNAG